MRAPWDLIRRPVELASPLPPEEVLGRLRSSLPRVRRQLSLSIVLLPQPGVRDTFGWVRGRHAWLVNGSRGWNNSWRPTLHVRAVADGAGTRLRGRIGWPLFTTAFMLFWFGFCGAGLARGEWQYAGFVAFGAALAAFGTFIGRRDEQALCAWLSEVVDAQPADRRALAGLPG